MKRSTFSQADHHHCAEHHHRSKDIILIIVTLCAPTLCTWTSAMQHAELKRHALTLVHSVHHRLQPVLFVSHQVVLAAAVACCWVCARKRAERRRHAALGGKVPAALPDIEQPPAQDSAALKQAETEQPSKPLQEGQPMSHPVEQFKMPGARGHCHGIPNHWQQ